MDFKPLQQHLKLVVRIGTGGLLICAAAAKAIHFANEPFTSQTFLPSPLTVIALIEFEILLGVSLIAGLWLRWTCKATVATFAVFSIGSFVMAFSNAKSCGCFGGVRINPWHMLLLDVSVLAAWLVALSIPNRENDTGYKGSGSGPLANRRPLAIVALIFAGIAVFPLIWNSPNLRPMVTNEPGIQMAEGGMVVLDPEQWIGKSFPLFKYIETTGSESLVEGDWLVVIVRHDCTDCLRNLRRYQQIAAERQENGQAVQVALIQTPPVGQLPLLTGGILKGQLDTKRRWFVQTPVEVRLTNGSVTNVQMPAEHSNDVKREA